MIHPYILGVFADYFGNPMSWVFMGIFILIGVLAGVFLRPWMGNQVQKFSPSDHRFIDLDIEEETSVSILCKKKKGMPPQRFFKHHPGFTGIVGRFIKKPVTRFLGLEGTAYTWQIEAGRYKKVGSLEKALRTVWGEDFWQTVPDKQKAACETSRIQVTVGLDEAPLTPPGMRAISEEDIKQEEDRRASKTFWSEHGAKMQGYIINLLLGIGTGFGIALLLVMIGIINVPAAQQVAPAATPTPIPETLAFLLRSLIA